MYLYLVKHVDKSMVVFHYGELINENHCDAKVQCDYYIDAYVGYNLTINNLT